MRKELIKICRDLKKWCEKYDKDYCTMAFVNGDIMASIDTVDKDYMELNIFVGANDITRNAITGEKYES